MSKIVDIHLEESGVGSEKDVSSESSVNCKKVLESLRRTKTVIGQYKKQKKN